MRGSIKVFRYNGKYCRDTGKNAFLGHIIIKKYRFITVLISDIFDLIIAVFLKTEDIDGIIFNFSYVGSFFVFYTKLFAVIDFILKLSRQLLRAIDLFVLLNIAVYAGYQRNKHNKNKTDVNDINNRIAF